MSYWVYYLAFGLLAQLLHRPWLLLGIVVLLLLRRWLPEPAVLFRTLRRMRNLEAQVRANPQNAPARRDLARIYLEQLRPGRAAALLDEALARAPGDAELLYLKGLALHRMGRHEAALTSLVAAVASDGRVAFGEPYDVAGDSLMALGRLAEAEDAYGRYLDHNSSGVAVRVKLARALARSGRRDDATREIEEARRTFGDLPGYARRRHWRGWLGAQLARATVAREPAALGVVLVAVALLAVAGARVAKVAQADLRDRRGWLPTTFGMRWWVPPPPAATRFERRPLGVARGVLPVRIRGMSGDVGVAAFQPLSPPAFDVERSRPGDLACRMNAAYGPGDTTATGLVWVLRDTISGASITARAGAAMSDYGVPAGSVGPPPTAAIDALEAFVDTAPAVDCALEVSMGKAKATIGVRAGVAFVDGADTPGDDLDTDL